MTAKQQQALATIATAAVAVERRYGLPADVSTAQAILESGWLTAAPGNNCKGIKAHPGDIPARAQLLTTREWFTPSQASAFLASANGRSIEHETGNTSGTRREYIVKDWFRKYETLSECFEHWATIMLRLPWFSGAVKQYAGNRDGRQFLAAIAPRYATDPNYVRSVQRIIEMQAVQAAIVAARKREELRV